MKTRIDKPTSCGCSCGGDACCGSKPENRVEIDFLFLDLSVCSRCQSTESALLETLDDIKAVLSTAGYEVHIRKIHIDSLEKAIQYQFVSSPTIRVNGIDIVQETLESTCESCGDLCGTDVDCRDWLFEGKRYTEPPKALITREIMKSIFSPRTHAQKSETYTVPENIRIFFKSKESQKR